jgi:hypothetical protein
MIAELALIEKLKFIISIDHVKSGMLFSDHLLDLMRFTCIQADTFHKLDQEMDYTPSVFSAKNEN